MLKFDVDKERMGACRYDHMEPKELAFHNALNRRLAINGREREIEYFFIPGRRPRSSSALRIRIPYDSGEIKCELLNNLQKGEKISISRNDLTQLLQATADFVCICAEHGYLIQEGKESKE